MKLAVTSRHSVIEDVGQRGTRRKASQHTESNDDTLEGRVRRVARHELELLVGQTGTPDQLVDEGWTEGCVRIDIAQLQYGTDFRVR